jgi:thioredoxin reductase/2-polyprenyl-3-methyl-5-hydroxy-6-metoxy-1,4-benzoquinol methylase
MSKERSTPPSPLDVIVIGGGPAGLSAALMLGRSRRSVVVIDAGEPRNAPAAEVHGLLGRDGMSPSVLLARGRDEARSYGALIVEGEVIDVSGEEGAFCVRMRSGEVMYGSRLLIATGLVDELPDIPGVRERWGRDVLHCPYCHGWEVRDHRIGVIGSGPMSVHQALLFRHLSNRVTFFAQDLDLDAGDRAMLDALDIPVAQGGVAAVEIQDDRIQGVRLAGDQSLVELDVVIVAPRMVARSSVLAGIGIQAIEHPAGAFIETDPFGVTSVPGVWAAGNVSNLSAQVGAAAAAGALAAQHMNSLMVMEDADGAVTRCASLKPDQATSRHDDSTAHSFDRSYWEEYWRTRTGAHGDHDGMDGHAPGHGHAAGAMHHQPVSPHLVHEVGELTPGTALDVGCGAGVEAVWLASRGWQVTAADISATALHEARARAEATEPISVTERVQWIEADLEAWEPGRSYDLVTTHYAHPVMPQLDFYERIGEWVAPGGTLLIVGHLHHHHHGHDHADGPPAKATTTAAAITARFASDAWQINTAEEQGRGVVAPDGRTVTLHDVVVRATRLGQART